MNSLYPDGPPDDRLPEQFASVGVQPVGWVRLSDDNDAELVEQVLRRGARVVNGEVQLLPEPPVITVTPAEPTLPQLQADLARIAAQIEQLTAQQG